MDLVSNQKFAKMLLDKITEIDIGMWDAQLSEIGDYVDIVCQGDDVAMQTSLQVSPEIYRKFIKPCHKKIFFLYIQKQKQRCGIILTVIYMT